MLQPSTHQPIVRYDAATFAREFEGQRLSIARRYLAPIDTELRAVYQELDEVRVIIPDPHYMAALMMGGIVCDFRVDRLMPRLTEHEAVEYIALKVMPRGTNHWAIIHIGDFPMEEEKGTELVPVEEGVVVPHTKTLVDGTEIAITVSTDRTWRMAWVLNDKGEVKVDMDKAREIAREMVRTERSKILPQLDTLFMRLLEEGKPTEAVVAAKKRLRDITQDPRFELATTPGLLRSLVTKLTNEMRTTAAVEMTPVPKEGETRNVDR